jgi:hypothetical protein
MADHHLHGHGESRFRHDQLGGIERGFERFPIAAVIKLMPPPRLLDWRYLGRLPGVAKKIRTEEARTYIGIAEFPSQYRMKFSCSKFRTDSSCKTMS